jgi:hypothetical protein
MGNYEGGDLVLWELERIIELRPGDLFFFPAHLVTHCNTPVNGVRHSLVAFTRQEIIRWMGKEYGYVEDKMKDVKRRQLEHRKTIQYGNRESQKKPQ